MIIRDQNMMLYELPSTEAVEIKAAGKALLKFGFPVK
jgi:hypothetical protein